MGDPGTCRHVARDRQRHHQTDHGDRMNVIPLIVGLAAAVGVLLVATGVRSSRASDAATLARQRLARQELGLGHSAIALELESTLGARLTAPIRRWLTKQMNRLTPPAQPPNFH